MRTWHAAAAAAGAAASLTIGGFGIAQAVSTIPPGTIHGCVAGSSRTLERVYTNPSKGTTCPSGTSQVVWPNGPDQPVTAGPAGLDVKIVGGAIPPGGTDGSVKCPADHPYALGTAYGDPATVNEGDRVFALYPYTADKPDGSEYITGYDFIGGTAGHSVLVYVTCAK